MLKTAMLPYHPQNIQRLISKSNHFECITTDAQRDQSVRWRGELAKNLNSLHDVTAKLDSCPNKWFHYKCRDSNMLVLLNLLDKMITIFNRKKIDYFSDEGCRADGHTNYKDLLVTITQNFMSLAARKNKKYGYLLEAVKKFLQDKGTGILQGKADKQGTVIKNKAEMLKLLFTKS